MKPDALRSNRSTRSSIVHHHIAGRVASSTFSGSDYRIQLQLQHHFFGSAKDVSNCTAASQYTRGVAWASPKTIIASGSAPAIKKVKYRRVRGQCLLLMKYLEALTLLTVEREVL